MLETTSTTPTAAPAASVKRLQVQMLDAVNADSRTHYRLDSVVPKDTEPPKGTDILVCYPKVAPGVFLRAAAWGTHLLIDGGHQSQRHATAFHLWHPDHPRQVEVDDFVTVEVVGQAYTKQVERQVRGNGSYYNRQPNAFTMATDGYDTSGRFSADPSQEVPYNYLRLRITTEDGQTVEGEFKFHHPEVGVAKLAADPTDPTVEVTADFFGRSRSWTEALTVQVTRNPRSWGGYDEYSTNPLAVLKRHLRGSEIPDGQDTWWTRFFNCNQEALFGTVDDRGIKSLLKKKDIAPLFTRMEKDDGLAFRFFQFLMCGKTKDKQRNNSLLAAFVTSCDGDYDALIAGLKKARVAAPNASGDFESYRDPIPCWEFRRNICLTLDGASDKVAEEEAKLDWRKRKSSGKQADGLGITADKYPKLREAIEAGNIPTSAFDNPDKQPVNREYPIWEEALNQKGWSEVIFEVAASASRRGTYEKDITPWLAFMLYKLPAYLDRHTEGRKKWSCMPRFVQSQWDLEMGDEAAEGGTVKRRSAFTPIADNDTRVVTVPYVAVSVSGVRTQWCYARHYHLFEQGFTDPVSNGIVARDLEPKLNGKDDYGLMFYTLTGTVTARGYPTFLIIFERRQQEGGTFVHFHRVHPKRSQNRINTPACDLVETCYQYMAGNIPATDITAQQGDMIYIPHPNDPIAAGAKVNDDIQEGHTLNFESHNHVALAEAARIKLYTSTAKTPKNRLGFLEVPEGGMAVLHPEHDDIECLEPGWYEVRRCRSWEANPKAIWSLTID